MDAHISTEKRIKFQNPRLCTEVRIRQPLLVPRFLWFLCPPHIGEQGIIVIIEKEPYSEKLMYTVLFEKTGQYWMCNYFEEELEFL